MGEIPLEVTSQEVALRTLLKDGFWEGKFSAGNKCLKLSISADGSKPIATGYLKNVPQLEPQPGATTALYETGCQILQYAAQLLGTAVQYEDGTENPHIQAWMLALDKGYRVFQWDEKPKKVGQALIVHKTFNP